MQASLIQLQAFNGINDAVFIKFEHPNPNLRNLEARTRTNMYFLRLQLVYHMKF